jgi:diaminohydroxyphosphoribosylaminopyrimidine deaminase/5-amino-6-(5-phosphoribosylamino)uracil reductase
VLFAEKKGILYVEGGTGVLQQFIRAGYWDEIRVIENTGILGGGVKAPSLPEGAASFSDFILGPDRVKIYFRQSVYGSGHTNV